MPHDIAIYGAGGYGREIACLLRKINECSDKLVWRFVGFFDDAKSAGEKFHYGEILGGVDALNAWETPLAIAVAIATPSVLLSIPQQIKNRNIFFPNIIAPDVVFLDSESVVLGQGNIIGWGSRISCNVRFGDFNIAVSELSVGHDAVIGSGNAFFPEARISGGCEVGDGNFFGMRSAVLQYVKIGCNTRVGAGAFLMHKTKDGFLYMGNPARKTELG